MRDPGKWGGSPVCLPPKITKKRVDVASFLESCVLGIIVNGTTQVTDVVPAAPFARQWLQPPDCVALKGLCSVVPVARSVYGRCAPPARDDALGRVSSD